MDSLLKYFIFITSYSLLFADYSYCSDDLDNNSVFYGISHLAEAKTRNQSLCHDQLASVAAGVRRKERWALRLFDASGVPETKMHWGNVFWLGSHDQCKAASLLKQIPVSHSSRTSKETIHTISPFPVDYFSAYFFHNSSIQAGINFEIIEFLITLGLCLPSSCSEDNVYDLVEEFLNMNKLSIQRLYDMKFEMESVKRIGVNNSWMQETRYKVYIFITLLVIGLCLLSTVYEYNKIKQPPQKIMHVNGNDRNPQLVNGIIYNNNNNNTESKVEEDSTGTLEKLFLCFSLRRNAKAIFDIDTNEENAKFQSISGMRFFLTAWVVLVHCAYFVADGFLNRVHAFYFSDDPFVMVYANAQYVVDSFVTIGGFLLGYFFIDGEINRQKKNPNPLTTKEKVNEVMSKIINRYVRFTPVYIFALGFSDICGKAVWNTTVFWKVERPHLTCGNYWWRNLLYIHNFYPRSEMCMTWSWYLSVDMQMFLVTSIILVTGYSSIKRLMAALTLALLVSNTFTSCLAYFIGYTPLIDNELTYFELFYGVPWVRFGSYVIGAVAGVIVRHYNGQLNLSKVSVAAGWMMTVGIYIVTTFGFPDKDFSLINGALYTGWIRTLWSISVAWFITACVSNYGGFIASFLSLKLWGPLSRVSFAVYITHPTLLFVFLSFREFPFELEALNVGVYGLGMIVLAFIFGILFSLLFDAPFVNLAKTIRNISKSSLKKIESCHCNGKED